MLVGCRLASFARTRRVRDITPLRSLVRDLTRYDIDFGVSTDQPMDQEAQLGLLRYESSSPFCSVLSSALRVEAPTEEILSETCGFSLHAGLIIMNTIYAVQPFFLKCRTRPFQLSRIYIHVTPPQLWFRIWWILMNISATYDFGQEHRSLWVTWCEVLTTGLQHYWFLTDYLIELLMPSHQSDCDLDELSYFLRLTVELHVLNSQNQSGVSDQQYHVSAII